MLYVAFVSEMEPGHGSPGQRFWPSRVGSRVSVSDPVLSFNVRLSWRCFCKVTPFWQTSVRGFGFSSVPVTALLVYLFQLVPVTFTYLRADCPCDVTTFLDFTSFRLRQVGSGHRVKSHRVGSRVRNPDPVPPLIRLSCLNQFNQSIRVA